MEKLIRRLWFAVVLFVVVIIATASLHRTIDREGYWRNPTLLDLFAPPVETAYRASVIKSIQQGIIANNSSASSTAAITAVTTANAYVSIAGFRYGSSATNTSTNNGSFHLDLTNATTVTVTKLTASENLSTGYVVVEYYPNILKTNQDFNIPITAGNLTGTATLGTAVTVAKAMVVWRGWNQSSVTASIWPEWFCSLEQTNTTTVTATRNDSTNGTATTYGTTVEFR